MISQLIIELSEKGEPKASKELAIAYLKHQKDEEILNLLGKLYHDDKEFENALECMNALPETPGMLINKAKCLYYLKRAPEAEKLIKSLPKEILNDPLTQIDLSLYTTAQGKFEESKRILKPLANKVPQAAFNYGWFLFGEDKLQEGYKHIREGAKLKVWGHEWLLKEKYNIEENQRWNGETVDTIAYYLEGGMGDEMIFVRYVEQFQKYCKTLKIFCTAPIKKLLEECGYENLYLHGDIVRTKWNKFVPAMSAAYFLGLTNPCENVSFPYLKKAPNPVKEMETDQKKIVIRWKGNSQFEHDQFRSIPIEKLLGLEKFGKLFSIQLEDSDLPKNANVWDLSHLITSWSDTYDIFAESDLVITSCTATAHLAGAMGTKVIVLPPLVPYITWASNTMNWYPENVVVLRQMEYNNWDKTIEKLYEIVENELSNS